MHICLKYGINFFRLSVRWNSFSASKVSPVVSKLKLNLGREYPTDSSNCKDYNFVGEKDQKDDIKEDDNVELPPSLNYVRHLMDHYKDTVILTQMGSFYELYFEQAEKYAPKLNIQLTSKQFSHGRVAFAGFPINQLNRHLKVLINEHAYTVAIAQQFKKDFVADNEVNKFYRRVTRIVTPGTFIDEAFEHFEENNYLLSIEFPDNCFDKLASADNKIGLCWCDITTGEIFVQQVLLKDLVTAITRIQPKEILLDDSISNYRIESGNWYPELVELKKYFIKYQNLPSQHIMLETLYPLFANSSVESTSKLYKMQFKSFTQKEIASLKNILLYVKEHLPDFSMNFQFPQRQLVTSMMQIDSRTTAALELHSTIREKSKKGSLLSSIRRTVTSAGTRLLSQWLSGPSLDLEDIKKRQDVVSFFLDDLDSTNELILELKSVSDLTRIIQRFSFKQGDANELLQLVESLESAKKIKEIITLMNSDMSTKKLPQYLLDDLINSLEFDQNLINEVKNCINEVELKRSNVQKIDEELKKEIPLNSLDYSIFDSWVIEPTYNSKLIKLHKEYNNFQEDRTTLQNCYYDKFISELGGRKVSLKQKPNGENILHIQASPNNMKNIVNFINDNQLLKNHPIRIVQKSIQTCWVSHKPWSELAHSIELARFKIKQEEENILNNIKRKFVDKSNEIRNLTFQLSYLDVLSSFAILAKEKNLIRPIVNNGTNLKIKGGRHLMVEEGLLKTSMAKFVKNDCILKKGTLWAITGPNMGGKSTFLRQNAIIIILAQIGCFCPCDKAHIGLVDKIFSRVGSADDLYNELSTFMVEMIETSFILQGATKRSLAILDEIGRGTSSKEGAIIAFATLKHLVQRNSCRSLFATHFGSELQDMLISRDDDLLTERIKFFQSSVIESGKDNYYYDHKLKEGVCTKSDAIKVAKSAGFPEEALQDAMYFLNK